MTEINLLPWRERRREQEKKSVMSLFLLSFVVAVGLVLLINSYVGSLYDSQVARNKRLQDEITSLDGQIIEIKKLKEVRDDLISRMVIVQGLQARRILIVHLFDELIKVLPDGVYLTEMKRVNDTITLQGYSESNTNISILMRNIQKNPWIQDPVLTEIKKDKEKDKDTEKQSYTVVENEFSLSFILQPTSTKAAAP